MTRHLALALLAAAACGLAACGRSPSGGPPSAAEERCNQQADENPAVKAILVNAPAMSADPAWQTQLARARQQAIRDCLSAAGIPQKGGVEPVGTGRFGLGWY